MRKHISFIHVNSFEQIGLGSRRTRYPHPPPPRSMSPTLSAWIVFFAAVAAAMTTPANPNAYSLRIIHTNDMHSRFEQISRYGGKCTENDIRQKRCYGGFPRLLTAVKEQRRRADEEKVPLLFLNAGDSYQGTAWYTVHKWKVVSALMNLLPIDAMSLGNHEFDDGVNGLVPFVNNSKIPIVTCNLGLAEEPELARTPLKPSAVFDMSGRRVGVIGYLTPETTALSQTGRVRIFDEIGNITSEARKMKEDGVDVIIAVGHSGYDVDLRIAKEVPFVDVVIGGHTNTFLYTGAPPDSEVPVNLYPVMVTQSSGRRVAVVQAYAYTKYLGVLDVRFDGDGEVVGAEGNPRLLHFDVAEDPAMLEAMEPWRKQVDELTKREIGKTRVVLDGGCRFYECNLGNLITDAFIDYGVKNHAGPGWAKAPIAIQQSGGIRSSINATSKNGTVTMEDIIITMPFANPLEMVSLKGKYLLEAFEWSVGRYDPHHNIGRGEFLQYSGVEIAYDLSKPPGSRIVKALVRCGDCPVPRLSPVQHELTYHVLMPSFLARGGDNYTVFPKHGRSVATFNKMDTDILADFIRERRVIYPGVGNRITFVTEDFPPGGGGGGRISRSSYVTMICSIVIYIFK